MNANDPATKGAIDATAHERRRSGPGLARARVLLWLWLVIPGPSATFAADALDQWLAHQDSMKAWTAEFRQTRSLAVLEKPLVAEGRVWFASPNRFRWELGQPAQTIAIRGTNELAVLYPRLRRAERIPLAQRRGPLQEVLTLLEAGFPRSRADLESRFTLHPLTQPEPDVWRLVLVPRSGEARRFMESLTLEFVAAERGPRATELRFADGTRLRNDFRHAQADPELPEHTFVIAIPEGYRTVQP